MKQTKELKKEKDNYLKFGFLFPVIISVIDAIIVGAALSVYMADPANIVNIPVAKLVAQAATILLTVSPAMLIATVAISSRHSKNHPKGSGFYIKAPMLASIVVWGCQTLYLVSLM